MATKFLQVFLLIVFIVCFADAAPVDIQQARQLATTFYQVSDAKGRTVELQLAQVVKTRYYATGSTQLQDIPLYYVFNVNTIDGFVMIAADDASVPILGYALEGHFDPAVEAVNYTKWAENYKEQLRYIIENNILATEAIADQWTNLRAGKHPLPSELKNSMTVNPLLGAIKWGQQAGFNTYCPGGSVVGCVATAMAQIMKYWSHPTQGTGFHSYNHATYGTQSVNYGSTTYDFSAMPNATSSNESAKLSYHCGVAVDMMYSPSGSGAYSSDAKDAFKDYFDYNSASIEYLSRSSYSDFNWKQLLKADLNNSQPLYYAGTGSGGGHAFVCDGYDASDYFHYNWGWSGAYDGYFTIDALNPSGVGTGGGTGGFNSNHRVIKGIQPNGGGGGGGGSASADLILYSSLTINPASPINFQSSYSVSVDIANTSGVQFNGDVAAALLDNSGNFVSFIETKSGQSYDDGFYYSRTFNSAAAPSTVPGTYSVVLYQKENGAANWSLIGNGNYTNNAPLVIQMVNSGGIELYASISPDNSPLTVGAPFSVSTNFFNNSSTAFSGEFSIDIHDMQGAWVTSVEVKSMNLGAGNVYTSNISFASSGLASLDPGTYQLAAWMRPSGGSWELVGNGSYSNPVQVDFVAPSLAADVYEYNDVSSSAYALSTNYSGTQAIVSTPGANIHVGSDYDYYRVSLAAGYSYFLNAQVFDSYNTSSGLYDNDVLFSYDVGNGFSETFDNASHTIIQPNGGTVIFKVASYYQGQTGSYELQVTSNRGTVNIEKITESEALSAFPIPADKQLTLQLEGDFNQFNQLDIFDASGQLMYQLPAAAFNQDKFELNTASWPAGIYFMKMNINGVLSRKTIAIQH